MGVAARPDFQTFELFTNDDPWDDPPSALWESNLAWNLSNPS